MSPAATSGRARTDALLGDAARYLEDTAPQHGGRNARPLAVPVLVTSYCATGRSVRGAGAALLGALGGAAVWFGFGRLEEAATPLAIGAFVVAAAALAGGVLLGLSVLRGGRTLLAALRRWHAVAPEVPVRGAEVLTQGPGLLRVILAAVGVLAGGAALVLAGLTGGLAPRLGYGIAGASLLVAGVLAGTGWWRVGALLRSAAPQSGQEAFAPASGPQETAAQWAQPQWPQHGGAAQPWQPPVAEHHAAQPPVQPGPPPVPQQPQVPPPPVPEPPAPAQAKPWWPPPPGVGGPPAPQPAPSLVAGPVPQAAPPPAPVPAPGAGPLPVPPVAQVRPAAPVEGWGPPPSAPEPDIADTRYAADTTISGRSRRHVAVLLDDGRRLEIDAVTLVGRAPQPRPDETVVTVAVEHQTVSKTHAAFRVANDSVHVTDRASTNGTSVVDSSGYRRRLQPWAEEPVEIGSEVLLGSYLVRVRAAD